MVRQERHCPARLPTWQAGTLALVPAYLGDNENSDKPWSGIGPDRRVVDMNLTRLRALILCVSGVLVSSCAATSVAVGLPSATPSAAPGSQWVVEDFHGDGLVVALDHPAAWKSQLQPLSLHYAAMFGFLANFPLQQFCSNPTSSSFECIPANVGKVPMGGVLVNFGTDGYGPGPGARVQLLSLGTPTTVDGRRTRELSGSGSACLGSGADHSLTLWIDDGKPAGLFDISFCWLGSAPNLAADVHRVVARLSLHPDPTNSGPFPS
jgi:hypothetical protein